MISKELMKKIKTNFAVKNIKLINNNITEKKFLIFNDLNYKLNAKIIYHNLQIKVE